MFNLTVDTAHTFFVGNSAWLVHNNLCKLEKPQSARTADNGATESNYRQKLDKEWALSTLPDDLDWEAHHIVPWNHPLAKPSVDILRSKGINEHSTANLTWLPAYPKDAQIAGNYFSPTPLSHHNGGIHTNNSILAVNRRIKALENASTERIIDELTTIGNDLAGGALP